MALPGVGTRTEEKRRTIGRTRAVKETTREMAKAMSGLKRAAVTRNHTKVGFLQTILADFHKSEDREDNYSFG